MNEKKNTTTLFHLPASCSAAVHAALKITGASFDVESVDLASKSDAFVAASPIGKVPALSDDQGTMFEGGAINLWLSQKFPASQLMPDLKSLEGREALKWLFFCYGTLHPVWVRLFFPQRIAGEGDKEAVKALATEDIIKNYKILSEALGDQKFMAGDSLTLADLYIAATFHWESGVNGELTRRFPNMVALKARVLTNPKVAEAFAGEIS